MLIGTMTQEELRNAEMISLRGASQHNLQSLDLDLLRGKLTVVCGVSGSGKTSLALDTLYAEGQRRYLESFSAYTRQFLQRIDKPKYESLVNLPSSIAITREQRSRNNRSTVGTVSEVLEYLRIVFAKHANIECFQCGRAVVSHSPFTASDVLRPFVGAKAMIGFEIEWTNKSELSEQLFDLQSNGFVRLVTQGSVVHLADESRERLASHFGNQGTAIVIVDRVKIALPDLERISQSIAMAFEYGGSGKPRAVVLVEPVLADPKMGATEIEASEMTTVDKQAYRVFRFSDELRCAHCDLEYPHSEPRLFNFNSPVGACQVCEGFGETISIDLDKVVPDRSLSLREGAIAPWTTPSYRHELEELIRLAPDFEIPVDVPVSKLKDHHWRFIHEGCRDREFGGLNGFFAWLERKKYKMHIRAFLARWRTYLICSACGGKRLSNQSLAYRVGGLTFSDWCDSTVQELAQIMETLTRPSSLKDDGLVGQWNSPWTDQSDSTELHGNFILASENKSQYVASEPLRQVTARLKFLADVGLGYVSLARAMHTLSSGEAQRVMMTTLLGSSLVDVLYVFDEPTVGLHPQDTERVANALLGLRDRGNTVLVVEHEPYLMKVADQILEIGPGAGELGGRVTFQGTPQELATSDCSTGKYLRGEMHRKRNVRAVGDRFLELKGARGRNLQSVDLKIPLGCLTVMIGPSGAGKSTLVLDTLCPAMLKERDDAAGAGLPFDQLLGREQILECISIDQTPIQRSVRSSPATYTKAMDEIRELFAETTDSKSRNMSIGHFSFNSELGRCSTCEGLGFTMIEMQFMADMRLLCSDCNGKRFRAEVLEVRYRDLNIAEVLELSIAKAQGFFRGCTAIQSKLKPLMDLGLGYLPLGQNLGSLSAGESMRLKVASYLQGTVRSKKAKAESPLGNLIVMDEPTTGLHFSDVDRLIQCIDALIDGGHTILVIEHNQQLISSADHLIELGPGANTDGGRIIATGDVESMRRNPNSVTGRYL